MTFKQSSETPLVQVPFDEENLRKVNTDLERNSLIAGVPQKLIDLAEQAGVNLHTNLQDWEVSRIAFEYLRTKDSHNSPMLHFCPDIQQFASWDQETLNWRFGKMAGEGAMLGEFVGFLRSCSEEFIEKRTQRDSKGKIIYDAASTPLGKLGTRYLRNRGLASLTEAFKIPPEHHRMSTMFDKQKECMLIKSDTSKFLVVDFRNSTIRPATVEDSMSIKSNIVVSGEGERVLEMLKLPFDDWMFTSDLYGVIEYVFGGDKDRIAYSRRMQGKWMIAGNKDQTFDIFKGNPRSGKGVLLDSQVAFMGAYAHVINSRVLCEGKGTNNQDGYELGHLKGKRLVVASETKTGDVLNDQLIKSFTGGRFLTIRKINQDIETVERTFNLVLDTNHLPVDIDKSGGQSTRINVLWGVGPTIPREQRISDLIERITTNESEIFLAWVMIGAREYLEEGLRMPDESNGENPEVKLLMSTLGKFIERHLEHNESSMDEFISDSDLKAVYNLWCEDEGKSGRYKKSYAAVKEDLMRICGARLGTKTIDKRKIRGIYGIRLKREVGSD